MHLKQLKLAGFKSFVDPTVVHFPSQLVAVVGPNGCGKSNIIDAVRWVMGESSARNLRGESMTDVIFNGSSHRKSVGQASVELVFDNSLGRLTGPFASYGEIAVKRVVTRDGDSSYYLNGSRCRRKDITDIFLGTGAGARGYSIIGQGTISQLIEAKPEELRVFLEEAAGVSKYKERRRETLQRIAHTRENLTRVADIRDELDKQLQRLERQAKAAERYLILKDEEHLCRAEILALKWQDLVSQQEAKQQQLQDLAVHYEQQQSALTKVNKERIILNEKIYDVDEQTQQIQASFYQLGTEIARLEETIQQQIREKKRLEQDQQQMQADWQAIAEQWQQDKEDLLCCQQNAQNLAEKLEQLGVQFKEQDVDYQQNQKQQTQWELQWQEVQTHANNLKREFQVAQVQAQHLEEKYQQTLLRLEKLKLEQESISVSELQQVQKKLQDQRIKLVADQEFDERQLSQSQENTEQLRTKLQEIEQQLHGVQDDFHRANTEHAALTAAQRAARQGVKKNKKGIQEWFEKPRLMDVLQVESKWQTACERVLNETLHAYVLETFDELWPQRANCERQGECVVTLRNRSTQSNARPRLMDKIYGPIPANVSPLEHIYTAEHFDEALSWLPELEEYQSIITPEGFWLGQGWVKFVNSGEQDDVGFLVRQQKIGDLSLLVQELQQRIDVLRAERDHTHLELQKGLKDVELQQLNVNASNEALRTNSSALSSNEQAIFHAEKQVITLTAECEELQFILEETAAEQCHIKEKLHSLEEQCREYEQRQEECLCEKQAWLDGLTLKKKQVEESRFQLHHAELEYDREKNKMQQLEERIQREKERLDILQERLEHIALLCLQTEEPGIELKGQLAQQLQKHSELESQLTLSREQLLQLRMELEDCEKNILNCDFEVKRIQELIAQVRMEEQALAVRASSVQESLEESELRAQVVLEQIPKGITQSIREDELIALAEKIKRLGAINLAAIEEFATEQQRKIYLDEQYNDLSQALATLESAIEKMDKETRLRLENTFEEVNTSFKALFPRLFGGGRAQLELTCDNLLEAGIVVMAQPPGKRNSTIHLLSGGEKAMTAVALVFAIFQLNPSPFCMLDEVDAPLDDVNVGRFCTLVKEMSQFVQFLFITHNKVTMELADHLIGVTMREPGVSRLVAVDVTQALAME
ncbi:chromosome segregation protein SMC [Legionella cincinnatiensis]|uniref:Chromosome partition protein Smc n=1 Tax=Legionella cincinnatiensis TaxID=28085 RepID=A0A378IM13_9GAMM|nr:chromosome segregation protein SMC [Legionella cincinnatiensis]KTC83904.1 chromosome partition protein smc [Legionella cincinnatiensis]STX36196.1 chromosome partition protein smc [Legionella cincinnatiensis]